jgi:predicted ATPase/DNA-binding XRE family transcriptional regulator
VRGALVHSDVSAPTGPAESFGTQLRALRVRAGLSQEALAERAGLGVATLKALEHGQRQRPRAHTLVLLGDALGLNAAERDAWFVINESTESSEQPPETEPVDLDTLRLPVWLTSFIGRESEVEMVRALLDPASATAVRLLTLLGPGGVGKTRLAVAVASTLTSAYRDGVVFVDLAPLTDARLVAATIARALDVRESGGPSARELLLEHLRPRRVLLLLDNFEHLISAGPLLADLLQHCAGVSMLTTSRVALRLRAERRFRVAPLPTPPDNLETPEDVAAAPAVRLFVQRAQAVAANFELEPGNAGAVAAVCRRLDGMPLAIELAAARAGLLRPAALLQRLERRLTLLTHGAIDLPPRQQTLRQTLAWSYDLLRPAEQTLFRRLGVFAGGCSLDAVEAVCAFDDALGEDFLEPLGALVDNSLVYQTADANQEPRFGMLETLREYAGERLTDSGEAEAIRRRHANFYLELAEEAKPTPTGSGEARWLDRLKQEHANLHAALDWLIELKEQDLALRLGAAALPYWLHGGYFTDGRRLARLLDTSEPELSPIRARATLAAARLASGQGDYRAHARYGEAALSLFRDLADQPGTADAVTNLGVARWQQGRLDEAEVDLLEGVRLFRSLDDSAGISASLLPLACVTRDRGDLEAARPLYAEALARRQAAGDQLGIAHVLNNLGWLELYAGNWAAARQLAEQSLAIRQTFGSLREIVWSQTLLGKIALASDDPESAAAYFRDSLEVHGVVGNVWGTILALEGVAGLEATRQPERALRLAAAATALREAIGRPLPPAEQPLLASWLAPAHQAVSPQAAGAALTEAQAVAEALAVVVEFTQPSTRGAPP